MRRESDPKDLLQHLIDTERIFTYRVLAFSRNETQKMLSYDEDAYAKNADANRRTITELLDELKLLRQSTIALYQSFSKEMLLKSGRSFKGHYSVLSIAFMLAGHQRWHFRVVEENIYLYCLPAILEINDHKDPRNGSDYSFGSGFQ
jgi:hypothetical protein